MLASDKRDEEGAVASLSSTSCRLAVLLAVVVVIVEKRPDVRRIEREWRVEVERVLRIRVVLLPW